MYVFGFDTETTGMVDWQRPSSDPAQPHLVQLAGILFDLRDLRTVSTMSVIIRPNGWTIPAEATAVHGIDQATAEYLGVSLENAIMMFCDIAARADILLAHNLEFDQIVVEAAKNRVDAIFGVEPTLPWQAHHQSICTKVAATPVLKLPKASNRHDGFKWPSLNECYQHFYGEDIKGAHDALTDVRACINVFIELIGAGVFPELAFAGQDAPVEEVAA